MFFLDLTYYSPNTEVVQFNQMPAVVQATHQFVELDFEAGDGYYDGKKLAYYRVFDSNRNTVGYLQVALMTYTEADHQYVIAGAWVNLRGHRLEKEIWLDVIDFSDTEAIAALPPELRPDEEEAN